MDRELSPDYLKKRNRRTILMVVAVLLTLALGTWAIRKVLFSSLNRSEIRTAKVEIGPVENTINAAGEVQPAFEQLIASPIPATILKVNLTEGASLKSGEVILELDASDTRSNLDKEKDQLELKRNGIVKLKLELEKSFYDLKINDSIKAYRINALKADIENAKKLFQAGGGTRETVDKLENDYRIAQLEKRQLENDIRSRQAVMRTSIRETEITASIQEKDYQAQARKLGKAIIRADIPGVLTFVNKNLGQKVNEGEPLARVANLSSFKILGQVSDNYAEDLQVGMSAVVRVNDKDYSAQVVNIYPAVSNNVISFDLRLDQTQGLDLRPRMKVEVFLVTANHPRTLRVLNGPTFRGGESQDVFVIRPDGNAERRRVKLGLSNFDYVEVTEGLSKGEEVIISDLSRFRNTRQIKIKP